MPPKKDQLTKRGQLRSFADRAERWQGGRLEASLTPTTLKEADTSGDVRRGVMCAFALLAACQALAQEDLTARVKKAQDAARANAASAQGREWMQRNSSATGRLMIPVLNRCLPEPAGDIPTVFSVYVRLSTAGRVREVVTELDASLGTCMTAAAREMPFPEAPRDDYWIQVNMAAPL